MTAPAPARVGVFVCHCGNNIGGVVDVAAVVKHARTLPHVAHAEANLYSCSQEGLTCLKQAIREEGLDRVVVASCTPRTHEALFRSACEEAGLNRYLFEFVNIREHCSWIHADGEAATRKAQRLVRMGVAKACLLEPQTEVESPVRPVALVIGGGVAGLTATQSLARQGFRVHLVEREPALGGRVARIGRLVPGDRRGRTLLEPLVREVERHPLVTAHLGTRIVSVGGFVGQFVVGLAAPGGEQSVEVGTIVVATGADVLRPEGLYGYGRFANVCTQLELEDRLEEGPLEVRGAVLVNCVGARDATRPYCSRVCCATSLKNATRLKRRCPTAGVYVLHRDLLVYGTEGERVYRQALEAGVRFVRYEPERPPEVEGNGRADRVKVRDALRGRDLEIPVDLVVLSTPLVPPAGQEEIAGLLKTPRGESGFFLEAHVKLRPVEFATDGIYVCGTARWPADVPDCVAQAGAAAAKAAIPMRNGALRAEAITAFSDEGRCTGCGTCLATCPYGAVERVPGDDGRPVARVRAVQCKGCGGCVAACPNGAMQQRGFTDAQVLRMLEVCARD